MIDSRTIKTLRGEILRVIVCSSRMRGSNRYLNGKGTRSVCPLHRSGRRTYRARYGFLPLCDRRGRRRINRLFAREKRVSAFVGAAASPSTRPEKRPLARIPSLAPPNRPLRRHPIVCMPPSRTGGGVAAPLIAQRERNHRGVTSFHIQVGGDHLYDARILDAPDEQGNPALS